MITRNNDDRVEEAYGFFRSVYGKDAPGHIPIWTKQDKRTRWIPANELRRVAETVTRLAQDKDVYFGVGLQPEDLGSHHRGRGKDVLAIPGAWADIDVQGPAHKDTALPPTKDDALALLHEFPLPPTLVVDSGHGLQPWWLFKKLWVFRDEKERDEAQALIRQFQATLQAKAAAHGWRIDNTSDLARVMRPAGTWNRKLDPVPVQIMEVDHHAD